MPTSTLIDYERTYLCGRGVLRFNGVQVRTGEALTPEQLRSIARPEGFLSTGRIYPAPAGWTPPQPVDDPVGDASTEQQPPADGPEGAQEPAEPPASPTPAELEKDAQAFAEAHDGPAAAQDPDDDDDEAGGEDDDLDDEVDDPFV